MQYKAETREQIDRCIRDAANAAFTIQGTIDFIADRTGITISRAQIFERRKFLKALSRNAWNKYREDDYAYKLEYIEGLERIKSLREKTFKKVLDYEKDDKLLWKFHKSIYAFLDVDERYLQYLEKLPEIDVTGLEMDQKIPQLEQQTNTEVGSLSQRKF